MRSTKALEALRPYASGKLVVVFGAGGDRDTGKRPIMGRIAAENADRVIVTDDNPRSEEPAAIRAAILAAAPGAAEIGDRAEAIRAGIAGLKPGDVLLIAGKGHETGQIVGDRVLPISPTTTRSQRRCKGKRWHDRALDRRRHGRGDAALTNPARCRPPCPASRSTAARLAKGEAFFAIKGDNRDGHDFVDGRAEGRRRARRGRARPARAQFAADAPLLDRRRRARGLARSRARRARARRRQGHRRHRLGRQDRHQGGACGSRSRADGETHASAASYNNHWGVPLSLARCPASANYAVFEIGMNHAGEITPLTKLVRPHVAIVTTIEPVHLEYFGSLEKIADAKAEIFSRARARRRRRPQPRQRAISRGSPPPPRLPA